MDHLSRLDIGRSALWLERGWQWAWDRHGTRYSWAVLVLSYLVILPQWVVPALLIVAFEKSDQFLGATAAATVITLVVSCVLFKPGSKDWRLIERWAAGDHTDQHRALQSTYTYARSFLRRGLVGWALASGASAAAVGVIAGAEPPRLVQYAIIGATYGIALVMISVHPFIEAFMRPARVAMAEGSSAGDALPRSRPSFATWSSLSILAVAWAFSLGGAALGAVIEQTPVYPVLIVVIATALTLVFAAPITVTAISTPSLRPIHDLAKGTKRVAAGDFSQRLPVVQDDDLGALAASFNRMQAGLGERERLQAAFGSYVDPALASRLLEQGDEIFAGERLDVTVMFVDIRDFTPFAEANSAEDTVTRLNALFELVVPAVLDAGGHVNKYLGDGALAVFGAPNAIANHADAAVNAALLIQQQVADRFAGALRIGIGINTGSVIAGTIGGAGKLEFTLIGDTVNVAARIEQLTKTTGDTILLTKMTLDALARPPAGLIDRGAHDVKGKSATVHIYAVRSERQHPTALGRS